MNLNIETNRLKMVWIKTKSNRNNEWDNGLFFNIDCDFSVKNKFYALCSKMTSIGMVSKISK